MVKENTPLQLISPFQIFLSSANTTIDKVSIHFTTDITILIIWNLTYPNDKGMNQINKWITHTCTHTTYNNATHTH